MKTPRRLAGLLTVVLLAAACSAGTGGASPAASNHAPSSAPPSASLDPNAPVGTDVPPSDGTGGGSDGGAGGFVEPKPGQLDVHPVKLDGLSATVDGRHVVVTAAWTSGVEPCYVLDSIVVATGDHAFTITVREGHGPEDVACIEIAQMKQSRIDLGDLEPGTYTIDDSQGGAAPIEVTVS